MASIAVATSIGEEGLDIGEIDLIVCYEANKSPIRMVRPVLSRVRHRLTFDLSSSSNESDVPVELATVALSSS
jgi:hypothetical protein